jgi:hypothetical protein
MAAARARRVLADGEVKIRALISEGRQLLRARDEVRETAGLGGEGRMVKALDHQHARLVALKIRPTAGGADRETMLGEARVLLAVPPHPCT